MAYGTVISYEYEEETAEIKNPFDGTVEKKTKKKKIELVFNALTPIKYYNYVGRDLYADLAGIVKTTQSKSDKKTESVLQKAQGIENLTVDDFTEEDLKAIENLNCTQYLEFFINLFAAMVATREYSKNLDYLDIIVDLPIDCMITDGEFMKRVLSLLSFGLKKKATVYRRTGFQEKQN